MRGVGDRGGRVRREVQPERLRARRHRCRVEVREEPRLRRHRQRDRRRPGEPRGHAVDRVAGIGDQRLVPGVEEGERDVPDALLRADQRDHLGLGIELDAEPPSVPGGDRRDGTRTSRRSSGTGASRGRGPPRASPRRRAPASGRSGSPTPSEITSTPSARLSASLRSSSANRYGGSVSMRFATLTGRPRAPRATHRRSWPRRRVPPGPMRYTWSSARSTTTVPPGNRTSARAPTSPASFEATSAAQAPVPQAIVSPDATLPHAQPTPLRRRPSTNSTFVFSGNRGSCSIRGPSDRDVDLVGVPLDEQHEVRVPHRDRARLEGACRPPRTARPGTCRRRRPASGSRPRANAGRPIPTVTDSTTPPRTSSERCFVPSREPTRSSVFVVWPRSNTSLPRHRIPLPHISASEPSALR